MGHEDTRNRVGHGRSWWRRHDGDGLLPAVSSGSRRRRRCLVCPPTGTGTACRRPVAGHTQLGPRRSGCRSSGVHRARPDHRRGRRLGREQPHDNLVLTHFQREHGTGAPMRNRARPQKIHGQRRIVRRHHCLAGQIQVRRIVDLHAAHRHRGCGRDRHRRS